jgi:hypothetical protein
MISWSVGVNDKKGMKKVDETLVYCKVCEIRKEFGQQSYTKQKRLSIYI